MEECGFTIEWQDGHAFTIYSVFFSVSLFLSSFLTIFEFTSELFIVKSNNKFSSCLLNEFKLFYNATCLLGVLGVYGTCGYSNVYISKIIFSWHHYAIIYKKPKDLLSPGSFFRQTFFKVFWLLYNLDQLLEKNCLIAWERRLMIPGLVSGEKS